MDVKKKKTEKWKIVYLIIGVLYLCYFVLNLLLHVNIAGSRYYIFTEEFVIGTNHKGSDPIIFSERDIANIKRLKKLKFVNISDLENTDYSFLEGMTELEGVVIFRSLYSLPADISALENADLKRFTGSLIGVTDLSAFRNMTNLEWLFIDWTDETRINDISDVRYLTNLKQFNCSVDGVTDISALQYCTNLSHLTIRGTNADDYSVLLELPNLQYLNIDEGNLTDEEIKILEKRRVDVSVRESEKVD